MFINYKTSDEEAEERRKQRQIQQEIEDEENRKKEERRIAGISSGEEADDNEMDFKQYSESETDEEDRKKLMIVKEPEPEEFATLRPETIDEKFFDAKRDLDSDSDMDEFGRLKDRQRPSSTLFDFLPPLKPDERLDNGDITNCKNRLSRHVVIIREALARNERRFH